MIRSFPLTRRLRRKMAAAVAVAVTALLPLAAPTAPTAQASDGAVRKADAAGGYWMVASDGGIFSFGAAPFYGSTGDVKLNQPIVGMAATPTGGGYWFVAADGGIFTFGDAKFFGSTGAVKLNKPIVGMAPTPSGKGYWFVASDGGIFTFGDAKFFGSTGDVKLAKPITSMAATPSGKGYWFTASDGGVFTFGDAKFFGAQPKADRTVAAMVPAPDGAGYWMASSTGELLSFGSAANLGGLTKKPNLPIVGMTAAPLTAAGPTGTTQPTGGTNPTTTTPTTVTTLPPYTGPMKFSSTALKSWGTPPDPEKSRTNSATTEADCTARRGVWAQPSGPCRVFPYSEKIVAIVEIGNRVFVGGYFKDLHQPDSTPKNPIPSGVPGGLAYLAELDTAGNVNPNSPFNMTARLDGPVRALYTDGSRLFVGGQFNKVNGQNRPHLVALNPNTGGIDESFNPPAPDKYVNAIAGTSSRIYVAGAYANLGGTAKYQLAAFLPNGTLDTGFNPPARYSGKFVGHTGKRVDDPLASDPTMPDPNGSIEALLVNPDGRTLMVGGSFLHFGYDHAADPNHKHSGLIAIDAVSGGLCGASGVQCTWQPEQSSNSSRPIFGMAAYRGDPKSIGVNSSQLIFTASGGAGGRVIAWVPGAKTTQLWRGNMDGDALSVAVTQDRVYVVGHYDHTVPDPNDPCLELRDQDPTQPGDQLGVSCPDGTPSRHLAAFMAAGEIVSGKNTGKSVIDTEFRAQADTSEGPYVVHLGANRMYVGGNFTDIANFATSQSCPYQDTAMCAEDHQPGFAVYPAIQ